MNLIKSKSFFVIFMSLILIVLSLMIWLRYDTSVKAYSELQQTLMDRQAEQAANGIDELIVQIREKMSAISLDRLWLDDLSEFADNVDIQEELAQRFKLYFPKMHTYVIADAHGEQIGGDYNFFIEDVCQQDINNVARMLQPQVDYFEYEPYIHPKPGNYHFDIMMPVFAKGNKLVFFMSFDAKMIRDKLAARVISDHSMYIVKKDNPSLIEVSTLHVRDELQRPFHLSTSEIKLIKASQDIPHTLWRVVVAENQTVIDEFKQQQIEHALISFLVVFVFWFAVFWMGLHHETARGRLMDNLSKLSHYDELTQLANRRKLIKEMTKSLDDAKFVSQLSAIIFVDLNGFKQINDEHGHKAGDEVLKHCALRLQHFTRQSDLVARLGGDEFVVLLRGLGEDENQAKVVVEEMVRRLRERLSQQYEFKDKNFSCLPSIGIRLITADDHDVNTVLHEADEQMYENKRSSKINA